MLYENVTAYCEKEKISISTFEKRCGIGNGTVGRWKNNSSLPTLATLEKIVKETKVPITEWMK